MITANSDFEATVKSGFYVDKTMLLSDLLPLCDSGSSVIVNRPRRFGKSLSVSMIDAFFNRSKKELSNLFDGLLIAGVESAKAYQNAYPVIRLSFVDVSDVKGFDPILYLKRMIAEQFALFHDAVMPFLSKQEAKDYEGAIDLSASWTYYLSALKHLTDYLCRAFKKKPIVLVDEYDLLVEKFFGKDEFDCIPSLKTIYGALLKDNPSLGFGFLTGVFPLARGTLGSGLNNIPSDNGTSALFSDNYFGFSEAEVEGLLRKCSIPSSEMPKLEEYYGGYFYYGKRYFNPWSILSFLQSRVYTPFWSITARDELFSSLLERRESDGKTLDALMQGNEILLPLDFSISYEDLDLSINNASLYLFLAGYLSVRQVDFSNFAIWIPNREARNAFDQEIAKQYKDKEGLMSLIRLKEAFRQGDEDKIESFLTSFFLSALSYYDFSDEKSYQIVVGTLSALLFGDSIVKFEVIGGEGRCDIMISPKNEGGFGCVIEIKHYKNKLSSARLQSGAMTALRQIKNKDYIEELRLRDARPLVAFGFAFHKKKVAVKKEIIR